MSEHPHPGGTMKPFWQCAVAAAPLAAAILGAPAALAVPSFGNDDLKGEYLFVVVEVRRSNTPTGVPPVHCVIAGAATFDGAGLASLNATQRCNTSAGATVTETVSGTQYYSVNPDGSFLMSESADLSDPVHGQLVEHGRALLLDGTLRTLSEIIGWWGTAMKR